MQILKYREQIRDMLNHGKLREVVNNIKDKKDNWCINFTTKHPAAWIYGKIDRTECQLVVDMGAEVGLFKLGWSVFQSIWSLIWLVRLFCATQTKPKLLTLKFFGIKSSKSINEKQNINKKKNFFFWSQIIIKIIKFKLKNPPSIVQ